MTPSPSREAVYELDNRILQSARPGVQLRRSPKLHDSVEICPVLPWRCHVRGVQLEVEQPCQEDLETVRVGMRVSVTLHGCVWKGTVHLPRDQEDQVAVVLDQDVARRTGLISLVKHEYVTVLESHTWLSVTGYRTSGARKWTTVVDMFLPFVISGTPVLDELNKDPWDDELEEEQWPLQQVEADQSPEKPSSEQNYPTWSQLEKNFAELLKKMVLKGSSLQRWHGALFEVVADRVAVRSAPSMTAAPQGFERKGGVVRLFQWDGTRQWRVVVRDGFPGWMMLDHPQIGPLLRPYGLAFQSKPLHPVWLASMEGDFRHLEKFLNEDAEVNVYDCAGRSALSMAVEKKCHKCVVLLLTFSVLNELHGSGLQLDIDDSSRSALLNDMIECVGGIVDKRHREKARQVLEALSPHTLRTLAEESMTNAVQKDTEEVKSTLTPQQRTSPAQAHVVQSVLEERICQHALAELSEGEVRAMNGKCTQCGCRFESAAVSVCCPLTVLCLSCCEGETSAPIVCHFCNSTIQLQGVEILSRKEARRKTEGILREIRHLRRASRP